LLALLCEQLHERLQQEPAPPRTVINLTAGQWHEIHDAYCIPADCKNSGAAMAVVAAAV
jgi:hypothetical protein